LGDFARICTYPIEDGFAIMAGSGKRDAYTELFVAYYHMVFNAVYTKVGRQDDAEDICQEVFIVLYNNIDRVENVRAWLYGTLRNLVYAYYRSKSTAPEDIDGIMDDVALSFTNGFRDARIIIEEVLGELMLDDEARNIIELVAYHGYSYSETAGLLGLTKRKVDYRYKIIAAKITAGLRERGVSHIEDLL
jgi:RNA polymerase sigma-70 factor, ECF subfamily